MNNNKQTGTTLHSLWATSATSGPRMSQGWYSPTSVSCPIDPITPCERHALSANTGILNPVRVQDNVGTTWTPCSLEKLSLVALLLCCSAIVGGVSSLQRLARGMHVSPVRVLF